MAVEILKQTGYTISGACQALGFARSGYYHLKQPRQTDKDDVKAKDVALLENIKAIKVAHPFWGYRRLRSW